MKHSQQIATTQSYRNTNSSDNLDRLLEKSITDKPSTLDLIHRLCQALEAEGITYCHWKSNNALDRSASGENDLDLLVSRADVPRFTRILCRLGFKQGEAPAEKQFPGVLDYYGYDKAADSTPPMRSETTTFRYGTAEALFWAARREPYLESAV